MQSLQRLASRVGGNRARLTHMFSAVMLVIGTLTASPIAAGATNALNAPDKRAAPPSFQDQVNAQLGLTASELTTLHIDPTPGQPLSVAVPLDGQVFTLTLMPRSVRSAFYQVYAQVADGSLVPVEPGPVRTLRGTLAEAMDAVVAGSLMEDGLYATVRFPDGSRYWIEPLFGRIDGAAADQYVVYRGGNTICAGDCGLNETNLHKQVQGPPQEDEGGIAGAIINCVRLACDADFEYYTAHGSSVANVEAQINSVTNTMNVQYETDVSLRHEITTIIVRTAEPDPYSSTDPGVLLGQFRTHWLNNQGAIPRDVAELFTGKQIDGNVIGIAWTIGGICTTGAYCLVQSDFSGTFACKTDLSAHELGHLWGGTHCSCPSFTMNPSITCANVHAAVSITEINNYKNSISCDVPCEDGTTTLPFFDNFDSGTTINPALWTGIDGATVNTTGTAEPSAPNSLDLDGSSNGGDELRSAIIDTTAYSEIKVEFSYERKGGGDSPETNDDLVVEFVDSAGQWVEVNRQLGSGTDMTTYAFVSLPMPAAALHANFRLRFRVISSQAGLDDWFVDNVSITGILPPANDNCSTAQVVTLGSTPFTTIGAGQVGPNDTNTCNFNGSSVINSDVWFKYQAGCNQNLTISICNANFDTKIAVYQGFCQTQPNQTIACNDDSCGTGSSVTVPSQTFQTFYIRVGSVSGAEGTGTLVLACVAPPPTGSCCLPDNSCTDSLTEAQCGALQGVFQGDGFFCGDVPCSRATGACCFPNGSCVADQSQTACSVAGGTYQGDGVTCGQAACPQPTGACCLPNGSCSGAQTQAACVTAGGAYQGNGSLCVNVTCPQPCPADVNGNHTVNIDDLLAVINAWGPCPGCPADVNGNGTVNIDDLLAVINGWGPCP